ncbi:MAG: hypothetical protein B6245_15620 [Desulfobacteraceae bacterium 4572_88]|nr:MAG: hypothetical protein B6245_15620 [Desulfobacteraceae bacterium 4572_88]
MSFSHEALLSCQHSGDGALIEIRIEIGHPGDNSCALLFPPDWHIRVSMTLAENHYHLTAMIMNVEGTSVTRGRDVRVPHVSGGEGTPPAVSCGSHLS